MAKFLRVVILVTLYVVTSGEVAWGQSPLNSKPSRESKVERDRKFAKLKKEHEQRVAKMKRSLPQRNRQLQASAAQLPTSPSLKSLKPAANNDSFPPFNPASAPAPEKCFKAYVDASLKATSMEAVMKYLPAGEQRALKESQENYDPSLVPGKRKWFKEQNPDIEEASLKHLTNPPYVNSLKHHKGIANEFLDILSVKVERDRAEVRISTTSEATIDGAKYPYSTATVEMVGEDRTWKLGTYRPGNVYYLQPPEK